MTPDDGEELPDMRISQRTAPDRIRWVADRLQSLGHRDVAPYVQILRRLADDLTPTDTKDNE